jgi:uncharacterized protein DUF4238
VLQEQPNPPASHWVPSSYLNGWSVPIGTGTGRMPHVWRIETASRQAALVPVAEALPCGDERETPLARMLARMEQLFVPTMREVIAPEKPLSDEDRAFLAFFAAAMLARTAEERDNWQGEWQQILEQTHRKEKIRKSIASPALIQGWATVMSGDSSSFTMQHGKTLATPNVHRMLPPTMRGVGRLLARMSISVAHSRDGAFITSDRPCVMHSATPDANANPIKELAALTTRVQLPLSPDRLLTFSWQQDLDGRYVVAGTQAVDAANGITQSHAARWLFSSRV